MTPLDALLAIGGTLLLCVGFLLVALPRLRAPKHAWTASAFVALMGAAASIFEPRAVFGAGAASLAWACWNDERLPIRLAGPVAVAVAASASPAGGMIAVAGIGWMMAPSFLSIAALLSGALLLWAAGVGPLASAVALAAGVVGLFVALPVDRKMISRPARRRILGLAAVGPAAGLFMALFVPQVQERAAGRPLAFAFITLAALAGGLLVLTFLAGAAVLFSTGHRLRSYVLGAALAAGVAFVAHGGQALIFLAGPLAVSLSAAALVLAVPRNGVP